MIYFTITILYSTFLIVTFASIENGSKKGCKKNEDCSAQVESQFCSLCVGDEGSTKCAYPFPDVYTSSETNYKCENITQCNSNPCKNQGKCEMFIGIGYYCVCEGHYYGKYCELKYEGETQVNVIESLVEYPNKGTLRRVYIIIFRGKVKSQLHYLLQTNEGYYLSPFLRAKRLATALIVYTLEAFQINPNKFLYYHNNVLGYFTTIQIRGYDMMTEVFRTSFKTFISYSKKDLDCMPVLQMHNCGPVYKKATSYSRKSNIFLTADKYVLPHGNLTKQIHDIPDCDVRKNPPTINLVWKVFLIFNNSGFIPAENPVINEIVEKSSFIKINPFALEFGLYWVNLEAKIIRGDKTSQNIAYCFFKINSLPIEPVIEHGSKRVITYKEDGLVMSAVNSKDPNTENTLEEPRQHLKTRWSCTSDLPASAVKDICTPVELYSFEPLVISPEKIPNKGNFNFTLEIWNDLYNTCSSGYCVEAKKHRFAYQEVVIDIVKSNGTFCYIDCIHNCHDKMFTFRSLVFKAKIIYMKKFYKNITFEWTYGKAGSTEKILWSGLPGTPSYIFYLPRNSLEPGIGYTVVVTATGLDGHSQLTTEYSFKTDTITYSGTCEIKPEEGIKGQTYFDIFCNTSQELSFTFEFMDSASQEQQDGCNLDGRMLGVSYDGILNHVILTRGTVDICIRHDAFYTSKKLVINLTEAAEAYDLNGYIEQLQSYIIEDSSLTLEQISLISDISTKQLCNSDTFYTLLKGMESTPITTAGSLKFYTSSLYNVLTKMNELDCQFTSNQMVDTSIKIINELSVFFNKFKHMFGYKELIDITRIVLNCLSLFEKLETQLPRVYLNSPDIKSLYYLSESFFMVEEILENLKNAVAYIQIPGLPLTSISSKDNSSVLWILKDDPIYNYTLAQMLMSSEYIPVNMSVDLFARLQKTIPWEGSLVFCAILMNDNLIRHWFSTDLTSNLLYLSLEKTGVELNTLTEKKIKINNFRLPIDIKMVVEDLLLNQTESGIITQLDPSIGEEALDLHIKVYRLDPEPNSMITITFLYPLTNSSLRVLITKDYRPPYNMIINKHEYINEQTPLYNISCLYREDKAKPFYYMTILPGPEVVVNNSVNYSFIMNNTVCKSLSRVKWSSAGCLVGSETRGRQVHCQCTHLSIFGAMSPYLPNKIDPFKDAKLFLTVFDNFLVVGIVMILFIVYLILLVWAYRADKKDQANGAITVLDDNFPGDNNAYLLAVYTSSRFLAGTSANVGVQLSGEEGLSRAHILKSRYYRVLKRGSDCWFLLFTLKPLGFLRKLHVWHDNSGPYPSWHCNEIHVYDLKERLETVFIVDQWLESSLEYYPEAVLLPATPSDFLSPRRLFITNFVSGIRAIESLEGVFTKHPRGTVTRFQLLNVAMCVVMVSMMCSIMFYQDNKPDNFSYILSKKELVASVVTLAVSGFVSYILSWGFRKGYEISNERNVSSLCLRGHDNEEYFYTQLKYSRAYRHQRRKRNIMVNTLKNILSPTSVAPATLTDKKPVVKTKKVLIFIAWITCTIVVVVSMYITMLYGLKLGLVKSEKWITSVFFTFAENSFIKSPLLMIIIAMVLTTYFYVLSTTTSYHVNEEDILDSAPRDHSGEHMKNLLNRRSLPMYFPQTSQLRIQTATNLKRLGYCINFIQIVITLLFILVIYYFVNGQWSSQYFVNSHLAKFIVLSRFKNPGFVDAQNTNEVYRYIKTTFLQSLYSSRWYNDEPLSLNESTEIGYWTSDFTWKLFGVPSIRQLRVKPKICKNTISANQSCIPRWSSSSEDIGIYDEGWLPIIYREGSGDYSAWRYTPPTCSWITTSHRLYSPSGKIYDNGGFIAPLQVSAKESLNRVLELATDLWLDQLTSVLFMEFTLCHSNSPLLSKITLMTEYLVSSIKLKGINVCTFVHCTPWTFWKLSFSVIVLLFTVEFCLKINERGLLCTLRKISNVILMIIVLLGLTVIILQFFQCFLYEFKERQKFDMKDYINYDIFIFYYLLVGNLHFILLMASIFRAIGLFKVGRSLLIVYKIFVQTGEMVMCLCLILFIYFHVTWLIVFKTNSFIWRHLMEVLLHLKIVPFNNGHVTNIELLIGFQKTVILFIFSCMIHTVFITHQLVVKK